MAPFNTLEFTFELLSTILTAAKFKVHPEPLSAVTSRLAK
jgi:hypothetical protein